MKPVDNPWLKAAVVATVLPLIAWPSLLSRSAQPSLLVWCYPIVCVVYGWLALACARERLTLSWVLVVMSLLTSAAIWML
ncbi:MAG: hypothetical protein K2M12_03295 [Muribaculaceae bacterium]|nr:hypothetical protein [Muribaculaceae bacterium]